MEITSNEIQTVNIGSNILFNQQVIKGSNSILHREGSGLVTLRGLPNGQCRARFKVTFNGNIGAANSEVLSAATVLSVAIAQNAESINSTKMNVTVASTDASYNVAATTLIDVPVGCCTSISIKNLSDIRIDVQNANMIVERIA